MIRGISVYEGINVPNPALLKKIIKPNPNPHKFFLIKTQVERN